jgi:hypothetical protein
LRANWRASWLRHVDSRLDDMDAAQARRYKLRGGGEVPSEASALCPSVAAADRYSAAERPKLPGGGAGEAHMRCGGELERGRWRNHAAAQVGKWRARARGEISSCCRRVTYGAPDSAKNHAHQYFCSATAGSAPAGGPISSPHTAHTGGFYSAACLRCSKHTSHLR